MKEKDRIVLGYVLEGKLNTMANSIEIAINKILEKNNIRPARMLGEKITQVSGVIKNRELVRDLREFNKIWNIIKHGSSEEKDHIKLKNLDITKRFTKVINELISVYSS